MNRRLIHREHLLFNIFFKQSSFRHASLHRSPCLGHSGTILCPPALPGHHLFAHSRVLRQIRNLSTNPVISPNHSPSRRAYPQRGRPPCLNLQSLHMLHHHIKPCPPSPFGAPLGHSYSISPPPSQPAKPELHTPRLDRHCQCVSKHRRWSAFLLLQEEEGEGEEGEGTFEL